MKIKELLDVPEKWIKGRECVDKFNSSCLIEGSHACRWCLVGALYKCYPDYNKRILIVDKILSYLFNIYLYEEDRFGLYNRDSLYINKISRYNDDSKTTFEDIKKLVTELDI